MSKKLQALAVVAQWFADGCDSVPKEAFFTASLCHAALWLWDRPDSIEYQEYQDAQPPDDRDHLPELDTLDYRPAKKKKDKQPETIIISTEPTCIDSSATVHETSEALQDTELENTLSQHVEAMPTPKSERSRSPPAGENEILTILRVIQADVAANKSTSSLLVNKIDCLDARTEATAVLAQRAKDAAEQAVAIATEAKEIAATAKSSSCPSTRASATPPEVRTVQAIPTPQKEHIPALINLQGYIQDWSDPDASAVLNTEMPSIVKPILEKLAEHQKRLVDFERTLAVPFRPFLSKLPVVLSEPASREKAFRLKTALQQVLTKFPELAKVGGKEIHAAIPADADRRALYKQGAFWHQAMERHQVAKENYIIEYIGKTAIKTYIKRSDDPRPVRVATYDTKDGWALAASALERCMPAVKAEELYRELCSSS